MKIETTVFSLNSKYYFADFKRYSLDEKKRTVPAVMLIGKLLVRFAKQSVCSLLWMWSGVLKKTRCVFPGIITRGSADFYIESYILLFSKDRHNWKVYKAALSREKKVCCLQCFLRHLLINFLSVLSFPSCAEQTETVGGRRTGKCC